MNGRFGARPPPFFHGDPYYWPRPRPRPRYPPPRLHGFGSGTWDNPRGAQSSNLTAISPSNTSQATNPRHLQSPQKRPRLDDSEATSGGREENKVAQNDTLTKGLKADVQRLEKENAELRRAKEDAADSGNKANSNCDRLQKELDEMQDGKCEAQQELRQRNSELARKLAELKLGAEKRERELAGKIERDKERIETLQTENTNLEATLAKLKIDHQNETAHLRKCNAEQQSLRAAAEREEELQKELKNIKEGIESFEQEKRILQDELTDCHSEKEDLVIEAADQRAACKDAEAKNAWLLTEKTELARKYESLKQINGHLKHNEMVQKELSELKAERKKLSEEVINLRKDKESLSSPGQKTTSAQHSVESLCSAWDKRKNNGNKLESEVELPLQDRHDRLKIMYSTAQTKIKELESKQGELNETLRSSKQDLESLLFTNERLDSENRCLLELKQELKNIKDERKETKEVLLGLTPAEFALEYQKIKKHKQAMDSNLTKSANEVLTIRQELDKVRDELQEKVKELNNRAAGQEDTENKFGALTDELSKAKGELAESVRRCQSLQKDMECIRAEKQNLERELTSLKSQFKTENEWAELCDNLEQEVDRLKKSKTAEPEVEQKVNKLEKRIRKAKLKQTDLHQRCRTLEEENKQLVDKQENLEGKLRILEAELSTKETERSDLTTQCEQLKKDLTQRCQSVEQKLKTHLYQLMKQKDSEHNATKDKLRMVVEQLGNVEQQRASLAMSSEDELKQWQEKFAQCDEERSMSAVKVVQLNEDLEKNQNHTMELQQKISELKKTHLKSLTSAQNEVELKIQEQKRLTGVLQDAKLQLDDAQSQLKVAKQQLEKSEKQRAAIDHAWRSYTNKCQELQQTNKSLTDQMANLVTNQLQSEKGIRDELHAKCQELDQIKSSRARLEDKLSSMEVKCVELDGLLEKLKREQPDQQQLQSALEQLQQEKRESEDQFSRHLQSKDEMLNQLKLQLAEAQTQLDQIQAVISSGSCST